MGVALANFSGGKHLEPLFDPEFACWIAGAFMPLQTIPQGTILALTNATAANEVQTLNFSGSGDIPTGGTFPVLITGVDGGSFSTAELTYAITNANLKIALDALLAAAGYAGATVAITNGPAPIDTTITFGGTAAAWNMPLMTTTAASLTSSGTATATIDATTAGVTKGVWGPYVGTKLTDPTTGPTVASKTGGSTLPVLGQYMVQYSYGTASGETMLSAPSPVALTTTDRIIAVSSITLPANATTINLYVNGAFVHALTATGAYDISTLDTAGLHPVPVANTAFTNTDGRGVARGIAVYDFRTNEMGQVVFGSANAYPQAAYELTAALYIRGYFATGDLVGLTAAAVADLGKMLNGTYASGILSVG